ncbi:MAG: leucine-rich repeat domain-containing protein [Clostridia bacterium]|nr:leucine-rich repeat domain-containing protein [Clostridia bacterium]
MKKNLSLILAVIMVLGVLAGCAEHVHFFGEWTTIKKPTCIESGLRERYCSCGEKQQQIIQADGHVMVEGVCSVCGYSEKHFHKVGSDWYSDEAHHWRICEECGDKAEEGAHSFGEWKITKNATEQQEGEKKRQCTMCKYEQTEIIAVLSHTHNWSNKWSSNSTNHWHACASCQEKNSNAKHSFSDWIITKEATTTAKGAKYRTCTVCGYKQTESIAKVSHTHEWGNWNIITYPTEQSNGEMYHKCSKCGATENQVLQGGKINPIKSDGVIQYVGSCFYNGSILCIPETCNNILVEHIDFLEAPPKGIEIIIIPKSVKSIGVFPAYIEGVDGVRQPTYRGSLKEVVIQEGSVLTEISSHCFNDARLLEKINLPQSLRKLGEGAFENCSKLKDIGQWPQYITSVPGKAFENCSSLDVLLPNTITAVGANAFAGTSITKISFNSVYLGTFAFTNSKLKSVYIKQLTNRNGDNTSCQFSNCNALEEIVINELETIPRRFLSDCSNLKKAELSKDFKNKRITIGDYAFQNCSNLISIITSEEIWIRAYAFAGCLSLEKIEIRYFAGYIPNNCFSGCAKLSSVTFERWNGSRAVGTTAFLNCKNLSNITVPISVSEWNKMTKGDNWDYGTGSYIVHCSDGDVVKTG